MATYTLTPKERMAVIENRRNRLKNSALSNDKLSLYEDTPRSTAAEKPKTEDTNAVVKH